jgi:hypothetical protein
MITSANKKYGAYWMRIKVEFDESKIVDKGYTKMVMKRSQKAMSIQWSIIQATVKTFQ